ncbi:MAG: PleD family two-component system response regulator [Hyphomonadaceae bacterium]
MKRDNAEEWPRLLVVDDVDDNRNILTRRLMVAHFEVDEAASGYECLEMLERERYAAVLLDYMMPGLDGLETLKRIRAKWPKSALPVIFVTARDDDPMVIHSLEAGANDHIAKPYSFSVLAARIRSHLTWGRAAA